MPTIFADERGIWVKDGSSGIAWDEIFCLSGSKLDGVTEIYICITLDFEYGEFVEFYDGWPGFAEVVEAITHRLPGIQSNWFQQVSELTTEDPPLEIWHR